jgi:tRNA-2-methylthio-N6-dimethylallyladenosine synthase
MTFFIKTFGCQMNVSDSEKMRHLLTEKGLVPAPGEEAADVVIVNSCAVRDKPQEKIFSYIGRFPAGKRIIVAGCVAQAEKEAIFGKTAKADYVVGTHQFQRIGEIVDEIVAGARRRTAVAFSRRWQELVPDARARTSRVSGYIPVMEGCDNFCSYCIVPFTRGREKHRPLAAILREAESLAGLGYKEIVLLGQNVNHWHEAGGGLAFPGLLRRLARVPVPWIRFITSYPGYHDPDIIRAVAENRSIARHIHLPAQSGSTRILKRMSRTYSRRDYLKIIDAFRAAVPGMTFSSDFIVGFPGESDHDFRLTLDLLERVEYESVFSFVYSPRPHTRTAALKQGLPAATARERLYALQETQERIQLRNNRRLIGQVIEVLVTEAHPRKAGEMIGRSESYRVVNFPSRTPAGEFTRVKVTAAGPHSLRGEEILVPARG